MKIDPKDLIVDESHSNPMVAAQAHPKCPINRPCFSIVVGFGAPKNICEYFKYDEVNPVAECTHPNAVNG